MGYNDRNNFNQGVKNQGNRQEQVEFSFPDGYLENGYYDKNGEMDIKYITEYALKISKELSSDNETGKSKIRAYYDIVTNTQENLIRNYINVNEAMRQIAKLTPRAVNRVAKNNASKFFAAFISKNVEVVIKDSEGFKERLDYFRDHFEAIVGFTADKKERR